MGDPVENPEVTPPPEAEAATANEAATASEPEPAMPVETVAPSEPIGAALRRDLRRGASAALVGGVALALLELVASLLAAQSSVGAASLLRFVALDIVLVGLLLLALVPLGALIFAAPRLVRLATSAERARAYPGLLTARSEGALHPGAPWLLAGVLAVLGYGVASYALTLTFILRFKEKHLIAISLAALQLLLVAAIGLGAFLLASGLRRLGARLAPRLGRLNPFGRVPAAAALLVLLAIPATIVLLRVVPAVRDVMPWRLLLAALVTTVAAGVSARRDLRPSRRVVLAGVAAVLVLAVPTLARWGAHPEAKVLAMTASPPLSKLVDGVRRLNDFDRDGYGSLLGENDCAPFDRKIHPGARDLPDNGIDENCNGRDFSARSVATTKRGERLAVPPELRRDWNVLLITIDALRFDHTGFGGYKKASGRDTTPRLDKLAARSTNFLFAHSSAPGTMAAVPAILAGKFFHSGIALGPERRPMPPKVLPQNVMIAEVMKKAGYRTAAILTHEYFNDWGLEQGFDSYDNSLGAKPNTRGITSHDVTSKAVSWIAKQGTNKWFLWAHYLDPHGHYVAHPGEVQFGDEPVDLYDGEIAYTDKHVGTLLDFLQRSSLADNTIVIVTSDHGDGFMEHGFINHAIALYKELMHVPLLVYIPENDPAEVPGPVSNIDILPTLADLVGVDPGDPTIEGESLVPQLFYRRDARDRVIFTETNFPDPLRSAVTDRYKLVYHLKANVYELYDLHKDPWEKQNVWGRDKAGADLMKGILGEWLDRVYYARDPASQAQQVRQAAFLSRTPPQPAHPMTTEAAELRLVGWDAGAGPFVAGKNVELNVWLTATKTPAAIYRVEAQLVAPAAAQGGAPKIVARQTRTPAGDGTFPTTKWQPGEYIKESFRLKLPADAKGLLDLKVRVLDGGKVVAEIPLGQISAG